MNLHTLPFLCTIQKTSFEPLECGCYLQQTQYYQHLRQKNFNWVHTLLELSHTQVLGMTTCDDGVKINNYRNDR